MDLQALPLDTPGLLAMAAALGWASGLRLYAVVFLVGAAGRWGGVVWPEGLQALQHPAVLAASGALMAVEFLADKLPWVDSVWDMANSLLRVPAGAALAAAAMGADGASWGVVAALMGGTLAATSQAAKTTTRAASTHRPSRSATGARACWKTAWWWARCGWPTSTRWCLRWLCW